MNAGVGRKRKTQTERKHEAEEALMDAACKLICERGAVRFSLAEVGALAGYSRGLVNHHFGTKEALIQRLSERLFRDAVRRPRPDTQANALENILAIFDDMLTRARPDNERLKARLVIWTAAMSSPEVQAIAADADRQIRAVFERRLREGQADRSIRHDVDPTAQAVQMLGLYRGVCMQMFIAPEILTAAVRAEIAQTLRSSISA
ncbi:MAG: TetR/AcrR family transcriptional regulator [Pseudomonadota bacterium]